MAKAKPKEPVGPSPYDVFDTDPELEKDGVWLEFDGGFSLRCRPSGEDNPEFVRRYNELIDPVREALNLGVLPNSEEVEREFLIQAYAETVITDARGNFVDREGLAISKTPVGYAKTLAELPRLFRQVRRQTLSTAAYRREKAVESGKG